MDSLRGPTASTDWIIMDPSIDFASLYKEFDTAVLGRKTYQVLTAQGGHGAIPGLERRRVLADPAASHALGCSHRQR